MNTAKKNNNNNNHLKNSRNSIETQNNDNNNSENAKKKWKIRNGSFFFRVSWFQSCVWLLRKWRKKKEIMKWLY